MNWRNNYNINDTVYIIYSCGFYSEKKYIYEGIVIDVTSDYLLVQLEVNNKTEILKFKDSNTYSKALGYLYKVYKDKEDYLLSINNNAQRKELINMIIDNLYTLNNKQLKKIYELIKNMNI